MQPWLCQFRSTRTTSKIFGVCVCSHRVGEGMEKVCVFKVNIYTESDPLLSPPQTEINYKQQIPVAFATGSKTESLTEISLMKPETQIGANLLSTFPFRKHKILKKLQKHVWMVKNFIALLKTEVSSYFWPLCIKHSWFSFFKKSIFSLTLLTSNSETRNVCLDIEKVANIWHCKEMIWDCSHVPSKFSVSYNKATVLFFFWNKCF